MNHSFSHIERQATLSIAGIFALRMLGLFMVLPLLSLYATQLEGYTGFLLGLTVGIYGLTQALLQIPFGLLSDRYNRKWIISLGLILFISGSILAAISHSIYSLILARALQGAGAVGSATLALLADLTREHQRSKAMAIVGAIIGISFIASLALGPVLHNWFDVPHLFWLMAILGMCALIVLIYIPHSNHTPNTHSQGHLLSLLFQKNLLKLNFGVFALHILLTTSFVVTPLLLKTNMHIDSHNQWWIYLPVIVAAALIMFPLLKWAEQKNFVNQLFRGSIGFLAISQLLLILFPSSLPILFASLFMFFLGFTLLEALLPAWVSRVAPAQHRGLALGVQSSCQFFGIFCGGLISGTLLGLFAMPSVFYFGLIVTIFWFFIAKSMKIHPHSATIAPLLNQSPQEKLYGC